MQGGNAAPRRRSSGRASLLRLAKEQGPNHGRGGSLEPMSLLLIQVYTIICSHPPQTIVAMKFFMVACTAATGLTKLIRRMLKPLMLTCLLLLAEAKTKELKHILCYFKTTIIMEEVRQKLKQNSQKQQNLFNSGNFKS